MNRIALTLVAAMLCATAPARAATPAPATEWIPSEALILLQVHRTDAILDRLTATGTTDWITSLPAWKQYTGTPAYRKLAGIVRFLEGSLGTDWRTGLRGLLGGGLTLGIGPHEASVLIADVPDETLLGKLHRTVRGFADGEARRRGLPVDAGEAHGDVTMWPLGGEAGQNGVYAIVGSRLLVASGPEVLRRVLDQRSRGKEGSAAELDWWKDSRARLCPDAVASLHVDLGSLKHLPPVAKALSIPSNPLGCLLFAGLTERLRQSSWLCLELSARESGVSLRALTDRSEGLADGPAAFAVPHGPGAGALTGPDVPGRIASLSLWRDMSGFYASKDDLFPERTSGLIFFENMMAIFFCGRDFTDEVLSEVHPETRLVVARQRWDAGRPPPKVRLPGFALVMRLRRPDHFAPIIEEAWQKTVGLMSFTRGQQALPGLIIDRPVHAGTKYTVAYFSSASDRETSKIEPHLNFRPSLVVVGGHLILSSTEGLARDLIDALGDEERSGKALPGVSTRMELDGRQLAEILTENRQALVRQNMVEKGHSRQEAEGEIDLLLMLANMLGGIRVEAGGPDGRDAPLLRVDVTLRGAAMAAGR